MKQFNTGKDTDKHQSREEIHGAEPNKVPNKGFWLSCPHGVMNSITFIEMLCDNTTKGSSLKSWVHTFYHDSIMKLIAQVSGL
jgi:hypothetical protein